MRKKVCEWDEAADSVENFKRRRALASPTWLEWESRSFFSKLSATRKTRECVFITKAAAKHR